MTIKNLPLPLKNQDLWAKSAALLSVGLSLIMIALKIYGWNQTNSLSILSSLTDSLMDVLVSGLNLFAIYYAFKPADDDHRFGHSAIEDIAGLFQAAMLAGTSLLILIEAINRFINPVPIPDKIDVGISVMLISIGLTLILVIYQRFVIYKSQSIVIAADNLHYVSDLLTTTAVLISLYAWDHYGLGWIDPFLAIVIVGIIAAGSYKIGIQSFNNLMDKEMDEHEKQQIHQVLQEISEIKGYHDLRTRRSGHKVFIQLHLELNKNLSLYKAHEITDKVERMLKNIFNKAEIIVHQDPV